MERVVAGTAPDDPYTAVLMDTINRWCREEFILGKNDCGLCASEYIERIYGFDCAAEFRGKYTTLEELSKLLGPLGLGGVVRRMAKRHNWRRVNPRDALPGAVGLVYSGMTAIVLCRKKGWFVGRGQSGISLIPAINPVLPRSSVRVAWDTRPLSG